MFSSSFPWSDDQFFGLWLAQLAQRRQRKNLVADFSFFTVIWFLRLFLVKKIAFIFWKINIFSSRVSQSWVIELPQNLVHTFIPSVERILLGSRNHVPRLRSQILLLLTYFTKYGRTLLLHTASLPLTSFLSGLGTGTSPPIDVTVARATIERLRRTGRSLTDQKQ